jgi:hypothetical protein
MVPERARRRIPIFIRTARGPAHAVRGMHGIPRRPPEPYGVLTSKTSSWQPHGPARVMPRHALKLMRRAHLEGPLVAGHMSPLGWRLGTHRPSNSQEKALPPPSGSGKALVVLYGIPRWPPPERGPGVSGS